MKHILLYLTLLFSGFCLAQNCGSDKLLELQKQQDPTLENRIKKLILSGLSNPPTIPKGSNQANNQSLYNPNQIITIPVVFNVIHNGEYIGQGRNISDEKIQEQLDILNEDYSGSSGETDTKIRFCLAEKDVFGFETSGVNRYFSNQSSYDIGFNCIFQNGNLVNYTFNSQTDFLIKSNRDQLRFPPSVYLNVWTTDLLECGLNTLLGYSSFPYGVVIPGNQENLIDGIVVDYEHFGNNDNTGSEGKTLTHEIGHYLGIFHTFEGGCSVGSCESTGDMICDTEPVPNSANNLGNDYDQVTCMGIDCSEQPSDAVQNYMDYAHDSCMKRFTEGQKQRMRDMLFLLRPSMYLQGTSLSGLTFCDENSISDPIPPPIANCDGNEDLPVQRIPSPTLNVGDFNFFGAKLEVNDNWLVTVDLNTLYIYRRIGCSYFAEQWFDIPLNDLSGAPLRTDFGLMLNKNEIIVTSDISDSVYIYNFDSISDSWFLRQTINNNSSTSYVGSSAYRIDDFLFVLESFNQSNNIFRIYQKGSNGNYVFHQNLSVSGFDLPNQSKYITAGNFIQNTLSILSDGSLETYDPQELLVSKGFTGGTDFLLISLNSSNQWSVLNYIQPFGLPSTESIIDVEISEDFIYVLTSTNDLDPFAGYDTLYFYSYRINYNSSTPFNSTGYTKQTLSQIANNIDFDGKMEIIDNKFLFISSFRSDGPLRLFYNNNSISNTNPVWVQEARLPCSSESNFNKRDFELFGNILYYGSGPSNLIRAYDMRDVFELYNGLNNIDNTGFFNKRICIIPNEYQTYAENIIIGESCDLDFSNSSKKFLARESITLKSGVTVKRGSDVTFQVNGGVCNSIIPTIGRQSSTNLRNKGKNNEQNSKQDIIDSIENQIVVLPNPTTGLATIKNLTDFNVKNLEVYSITKPSNVLFKAKNIVPKKSLDFNLRSQITGVYIIKVVLDNGIVVYKKIIKN